MLCRQIATFYEGLGIASRVNSSNFIDKAGCVGYYILSLGLKKTCSLLSATRSGTTGKNFSKATGQKTIMPDDLSLLLSPQEIDDKVAALAEQISRDYKDRDLVMIGVLKGAFIFLADLSRKLTIPAAIDFVWCSSYGGGDTSTENVLRISGIRTDISGKDVLIVEDILDTGITIRDLLAYLRSFYPNSIGVCVFIDKNERRSTDVKADYAGHFVEKGFLVGYGLDYAEQYRHLPAIYEVATS